MSTPQDAPVDARLVLSHVSFGRKLKDRVVMVLVILAFVVAVVPLVSVLWIVISKGLARFDGTFFTHSMLGVPALGPGSSGGGAYHAIIGTIEQVGLAALMAVPLGVLAAVYLTEYGRNGRLARTVSFFVDVMTGVPSIVAGLFVLALMFLLVGTSFVGFGFAASIALAILMLPTVVRSTEEMLKLVPNDLREASYALGVPRWRTITKVVLPTALTGIVTGVMLGIARIMGETAPVLLLVFGSTAINNDPFSNPQESLPLYVYSQASLPQDAAVNRAWTGALTLILIVMLLNLVARLIAWWRRPVRR